MHLACNIARKESPAALVFVAKFSIACMRSSIGTKSPGGQLICTLMIAKTSIFNGLDVTDSKIQSILCCRSMELRPAINIDVVVRASAYAIYRSLLRQKPMPLTAVHDFYLETKSEKITFPFRGALIHRRLSSNRCLVNHDPRVLRI